MSQPPQFLRQHNFTDFSAANPTTQQSGVWIDDELNAAKVTLDALRTNIAEIQRDDGALFNGIVTYDSLSNTVKALLGTNVNPRGNWVTSTSYAVMDMVTHSGATYLCATAHTSGTFATDLAAFKWLLFAGVAGTGDMSLLDFTTIVEDTTPDLSSDYVLTRDTSASANKKVKPINLLSPTSPVYVPTVAGTANAITLTPTTAIAAYAAGQRFRFIVGSDNTSGTVTVAVSGLLTKNIKKVIGKTVVALAPGDLPAGSLADIEYDGTQFELMSARPYSQGADIASATTLDLTGSTGDYIHITGTTTITAITLEQGQERTLVFDGILTLANSASLINISAANITTAAGDNTVIRGEASGVVRMVDYARADGTALVVASSSVNAGSLAGATLAAGVTASSLTSFGAFTDVATNNVSVSAHGLTPKLPNDATKYLDGTGAYSVPSGRLTLGTLTSFNSAATYPVTGLPAGITEINIILVGVTFNATSNIIFQIGDASGGLKTSGYLGAGSLTNAGATSASLFTAGFGIVGSSASSVCHANLRLLLVDAASFIWSASGTFGLSNATLTAAIGGTVTLAGVLDRITVTTVGGTAVWSAGKINVSYR